MNDPKQVLEYHRKWNPVFHGFGKDGTMGGTDEQEAQYHAGMIALKTELQLKYPEFDIIKLEDKKPKPLKDEPEILKTEKP